MELKLIQIKSVKEKLRLQENHKFHNGKQFLLLVEENTELFLAERKGTEKPSLLNLLYQALYSIL